MNLLQTSVLRISRIPYPISGTSFQSLPLRRGQYQNWMKPRDSSFAYYKYFSGLTSNKNHKKEHLGEEIETKLSYMQRIKLMWRRYGFVAFSIYSSLGFITVASIYVGIDQGFIDPIYWLDLGETVVEKVKKESCDIESKLEANTPTGLTKAVVAMLEKNDFTKPMIPKVEENPVLLNLTVAWLGKWFYFILF